MDCDPVRRPNWAPRSASAPIPDRASLGAPELGRYLDRRLHLEQRRAQPASGRRKINEDKQWPAFGASSTWPPCAPHSNGWPGPKQAEATNQLNGSISRSDDSSWPALGLFGSISAQGGAPIRAAIFAWLGRRRCGRGRIRAHQRPSAGWLAGWR